MAQPASSIPAPRLQAVRNETPFPHLQFDKMGKGRVFHDVVIVCASFSLAPGRLHPSPRHRGPIYADQAWDAERPELSSLKAATDVLLIKTGADVYVTGTAHSFEAQPNSQWDAWLRLGQAGQKPLIDKTVRLTGPRDWLLGQEGCSLSAPEPTVTVPLRYELAYGGWWREPQDAPDADPRMFAANPSGSGWFDSAQRCHHQGARDEADAVVAAPQIEYPDHPILAVNQDYRVAGLGPLARHWHPRICYAGTYDDAWQAQFEREDVPDYPHDFDNRFFQYAPDDQIVAGELLGDEEMQLGGFFPETQNLRTSLPQLWIEAVCFPRHGLPHQESMRLDTVHVDLDSRQVHLTWRITLAQDRDIVGLELFARRLENGQRTRTAYARVPA